MSLNDKHALEAIARVVDLIERGAATVVRFQCTDEERLSLRIDLAAVEPEKQVEAAQVAWGKRCPRCGSSEVVDAGRTPVGVDRLCIACQHAFTISEPTEGG